MTTTDTTQTAPNTELAAQAKAQVYVAELQHNDDASEGAALASSSYTIARAVADKIVQPLRQTDADIPDHRRITLAGDTVAIAHSVDAPVLASAANSDRPMPTTVEALLDVIAADADACLELGVDPSDMFLALYAAQAGHLPPLDDKRRRLDPEATRAVLEMIQSMLARGARFTSPRKAAEALCKGKSVYTYLPFGQLPRDLDELTAAPLRVTQDGPPASVLCWSGLSQPNAVDGPVDLGLTLAMADLPDSAQTAAVWLLDDFSPTAAHAPLLETIAAGAQIAPLDLTYTILRDALSTALAPLAIRVATVDETLETLTPYT